MIRIRAVEPLAGYRVRLTLTNGDVVERDLTALLRGPVLEPLLSDARFREVTVEGGTLVWAGQIDIAPETLIWNGPDPSDDAGLHPPPFLKLRRPSGALAER